MSKRGPRMPCHCKNCSTLCEREYHCRCHEDYVPGMRAEFDLEADRG